MPIYDHAQQMFMTDYAQQVFMTDYAQQVFMTDYAHLQLRSGLIPKYTHMCSLLSNNILV